MQGLLNRLIYLMVALALLYSGWERLRSPDDLGARRPEVREVAPPPTRRPAVGGRAAPVLTIEVPEKQPSTGTAFAIGDGYWLTARHVADGCDAVGLVVGPRRAVRVGQVLLHPQSDLALLVSTRPEAVGLPVAGEPPRRGQDGFALGYPKGQPGDVHGALLGRIRMRLVGRYRIEEPVIAWAERRRVPDELPALSGLSGGPMFDQRGRVVGVLVAASQRRGRVMTTDPSSLGWLLRESGVDVSGGRNEAIDAANFISRGDALRRDLRIAKVICQVRR